MRRYDLLVKILIAAKHPTLGLNLAEPVLNRRYSSQVFQYVLLADALKPRQGRRFTLWAALRLRSPPAALGGARNLTSRWIVLAVTIHHDHEVRPGSGRQPRKPHCNRPLMPEVPPSASILRACEDCPLSLIPRELRHSHVRSPQAMLR